MDDEITGMFQIAKILDDLDEDARGRVLRWAADKYGLDLGQLPAEAGEKEADPTDETVSAPQLEVKPASTLEPDEAPPERDPERPSFLDTSFRMYSGKQQLKKTKDEKE